MHIRFPLFLTVYLIALLSAHAFAMGVSLYYSLWWFDIAMHFAGGVWLGSALFYFLFVSSFRERVMMPPWLGVFVIAACALLIGVFWEFFEFLIDSSGVLYIDEKNPKLLLEDTLLDLFFDMAGALISSAALLFIWRIKRISQ